MTDMMRAFLLCMTVLWGSLSAGNATVTLPQYDMQEVVVTAAESDWEEALQKVTKKLSHKVSPKATTSVCCYTGFFIQMVRCNDHPVQLRREYALLETSDPFLKCTKFDGDYKRIYLVLRKANSLFFDADGGDTLDNISFNGSGERGNFHDSYDASRRYLFERMRWLYLYAPCFSPERNFLFNLESFDGRYYTIGFSTKENKISSNNRLYIEGSLVIDALNNALESMEIREAGTLYAVFSTWKPKFYSIERQAYREHWTFDFTQDGIVQNAHVSIQWLEQENPEKGGTWGIVAPRPYAYLYHLQLDEWWTSENVKHIEDPNFGQTVARCQLGFGIPEHIAKYSPVSIPFRTNRYDSTFLFPMHDDVQELSLELDKKVPLESQYNTTGQDSDYGFVSFGNMPGNLIINKIRGIE